MPTERDRKDAAAEIIYGTHAVRHALKSWPSAVRQVLVQEDKQEGSTLRPLLEQARAAGLRIRAVSRSELDLIASFGRHQGIALERVPQRIPVSDLESLLLRGGAPLLLLVLDGVQDPHNLGACIRSADAAGADGVIIPRDRAAPVNATVRKVASGAAENTPVFDVTNLARTLRQMQEAGVWIVGLEEGAEQDLYATDLRGSVAFVVGAEGTGIRRNIREHCDFLAALPMHGVVESLNVSVSAGICLYEAVRQRRNK